jgi:hypothetical protein
MTPAHCSPETAITAWQGTGLLARGSAQAFHRGLMTAQRQRDATGAQPRRQVPLHSHHTGAPIRGGLRPGLPRPEVNVPSAARGSALQDAGEPGRQRPDGQSSRSMHEHPVQPGSIQRPCLCSARTPRGISAGLTSLPPPGEPATRIDLDLQIAVPDVTVTRNPHSPGELLLNVIAARILCSGAVAFPPYDLEHPPPARPTCARLSATCPARSWPHCTLQVRCPRPAAV